MFCMHNWNGKSSSSENSLFGMYVIEEDLGVVGGVDNFDGLIKGAKVIDTRYICNGFDCDLVIIFDNGYALILEGVNGRYPEDWFMRVVKWKIRDTCKGCKYLAEDVIYDTIVYVCTHPVWGDDERILDPDLKVPDWCPLRKG